MSELVKYVQRYAVTGPREGEASGTDVYFLKVKAAPGANAATLRDLIQKHKGVHVEIDPLDGNEHSYVEMGGWLGSQEVALALIGLGSELEMWKLLSPRTMISRMIPAELEDSLVGRGYLSLLARREHGAPAPA